MPTRNSAFPVLVTATPRAQQDASTRALGEDFLPRAVPGRVKKTMQLVRHQVAPSIKGSDPSTRSSPPGPRCSLRPSASGCGSPIERRVGCWSLAGSLGWILEVLSSSQALPPWVFLTPSSTVECMLHQLTPMPRLRCYDSLYEGSLGTLARFECL